MNTPSQSIVHGSDQVGCGNDEVIVLGRQLNSAALHGGWITDCDTFAKMNNTLPIS